MNKWYNRDAVLTAVYTVIGIILTGLLIWFDAMI